MKKKIAFALAIIVVVLIVGYKYLYQSHRNIEEEKASFSLTTSKLISDFSEDETLANQNYLDKTIQIKGVLTSYNQEENSITVDEKLFGLLSNQFSGINVNDSIEFKGRFLGYDELLEEVKMDQITIIK
ncbi:OB-fold protein [Flavobacterium sp.]|uniref:OB-fold protein n=1 Tax=Flavobacterium sp. TaxID=239 RepID=UPI003F6A2F5D